MIKKRGGRGEGVSPCRAGGRYSQRVRRRPVEKTRGWKRTQLGLVVGQIDVRTPGPVLSLLALPVVFGVEVNRISGDRVLAFLEPDRLVWDVGSSLCGRLFRLLFASSSDRSLLVFETAFHLVGLVPQ